MKRLLLILILSNFLFAQTDLRHKITQMLIVGFPGTSLTDTTIINDIQKKQVGGVILFAQNITSLLQVQQLNNSLQSLSQVPLFISVDEEGGRVARLKASNGFENTFTAYQIGTIFNNADTTISWADLMGGWLSESKFNIDLAPVVDVDVNPTSPAIGYLDRSFSRIPDTVFFHSNLFISELHKKNIFTTLKHFPGHGSATSDSHDGFTDITSTWADSELVPYRKLIQNGYNDFIMSGHLFNANLDSTYPASLSYKVLTGLLRDSLKYNGLIITDGMFMGAITDNYSFDEAVTLAINAGNDITENRIDESYNRIMLKKQLLTNVEYIASKVIPDDFNLVNYPNPFNSTTQIMFTISRSGMISLKIFNILGEEIKEIANQYFDAGTHKISFNADLLSSGVYLIRMNLEGNYSSHKIILMK
jgi:beta-N-acetylhexosaminidase